MTKGNKNVAPSRGEDSALMGFTAQYFVAAELIVRSLQKSDFEKVILKDFRAEKVDDFQIVTKNRVDAYQVKWHDHAGSLTQSDLRGSDTKPEDSLIHHLATGWQALCKINSDKSVFVHLYTNNNASLSDVIEKDTSATRHLAEFIRAYWEKKIVSQDVCTKWQTFIVKLQNASRLEADVFEKFRTQCKLDLGQSLPKEHDVIDTRHYKDVTHLQGKLLQIAGKQQGTITLTRQDILDLAQWNERFQYKARHEFPNPQFYSPINSTVNCLEEALENYKQGYLALIGSPGSGKSTLLTKTLRYRQGICLLKYYCYIPNDRVSFRGEAYNFLHDLVLSLVEQGIGYSVGNTIEELRNNFLKQLQEIGNIWKEKRVCTIILIDGLDHIKRESNPDRSLLHELPLPHAVPEGCLFILGSQYLEKTDLSQRIINHLKHGDHNKRIIVIEPLDRQAIRDIATNNLCNILLSESNFLNIEKISGGHPLALNYILNRLKAATQEKIDGILSQLPDYGDTIEDEYQIYWEQFENDSELKNLLALLSRMRGKVDLNLMSKLASEKTIKELVNTAKHYFIEISKEEWRFFHNSFRQFILDKTGRNAFGINDEAIHRGYHSQLANLAKKNCVPNTFQWELLYHTFHSGNHSDVLSIGKQEYFRNQFFSSRPSKLIIEDTALVMHAAKKCHNAIAVIRVLLIESEINQRSSTLLEQNDIASLLLRVDKPEEAIKHVIYEGVLLIDDVKALSFACNLKRKGYFDKAKEIFTAAEPLDKLSGSEPIRDIWHESDILETWVQAAVKFRTLEEILPIIAKLKANGSFSEDDGQGRASKNLRTKLFKILIDTVVADEDFSLIEKLPQILSNYLDEDVVNQRVSYNLIQLDIDCHQRDKALEHLLELSKKISLPNNILLQMSEILLVEKKDLKFAKEVFDNIKAPNRVIDEEATSHSFNPYGKRLRYYRLNAALNEAIAPEKAVLDSEQEYHKSRILIERMIVRIANLWGQAWKGDIQSPILVVKELIPALMLSENRNDREINMAFTGIVKPYLDIIIHTAAAHGSETLNALSDELDKRWKNEITSKYWAEATRREVASTIFHIDKNKQKFISRLTDLEPTLNLDDSVNEFLENCEEYVKAWVDAGEIEKAQSYIPLMVSSSFGLHQEKDSQIYYWIEWFNSLLEQSSDLASSSFHHIIQGIATASIYGRGSKTSETASSFLSSVTQLYPDLGDKVRKWFLDEGVLNFHQAIEAFLIAAFTNDNVNIEILFIILRRLYLPYIRYFEKEVIEAFVDRLLKQDSNEYALNILEKFITAIEIEISPYLHSKWWAALNNRLRRYRNVKHLIELIEIKLTQQPFVSPYTKGSITLLDGTIIEEDDLIKQAKSYERLIYILENMKQDSFYNFRDLVNNLISELDELQIKKLYHALIKHERGNRDASGLIKKLFEMGNTHDAEQYALQVLKKSQSNGWSYSYDGGSRIEPHKILTKIDSKYYTQAFEQLTEDYLQGYRSYHLTGDLKHFVEVISKNELLIDVWPEIYEHFSQLREFSQSAVIAPSSLSLNHPNESSLTQVLIKLIFEAYCRPQPELREDAYKALIYLYENISEVRPQILDIMDSYLNASGEYLLLSLALIRGLISNHNNLLEKFRSNLEKSLKDDDVAVRLAARDIFLLLGDTTRSIHQTKPLPATYSMSLPEFATMKNNLASSVIIPGTTLPETKDTLQLVGVAQEALEIISQKTEIPFRNLVERTAYLMKKVLPESSWNAQAEKDLMWECKGLNLEIAYRRPRVLAAYTALGYVVAELYDNEMLDDRDLYLLHPSLSIIDTTLLKYEPTDSNLSPTALTISEDYITRNRDWVEQQPELLEEPPVIENEGIILGFITKAETPTWDVPSEYMVGSLCPPYIKDSDVKNVEDIIRGGMMSLWWQASQYPDLPYAQIALDYSLLLRASSQRTEIGRISWLALNPIVARNLGWSLSKDGIFRWVDSQGNTMVESQWWRSGRRKRCAPAEGVRAEGWIVKATPTGYKHLKQLIGSATWVSGVKKSYGQQPNKAYKQWVKICPICF